MVSRCRKGDARRTSLQGSEELIALFLFDAIINPHFLRKFATSSVGIEYKGYLRMASCIYESRKRGITQKERLVLLL